MNARMERSGIRDDRSHDTPHSAVPPAGYALQAHPPGGPPCPRLSGTASLPCLFLRKSPAVTTPCRARPIPPSRGPSSLTGPPVGLHRARVKAFPSAQADPSMGKTARHPWPAEAPDGSRLIFRGPVSGRLASTRRKPPSNRAAHRGPLDCSRPGLVRARVRLRLTPARVFARVDTMQPLEGPGHLD